MVLVDDDDRRRRPPEGVAAAGSLVPREQLRQLTTLGSR
ncbi:hypothetical protein I552_5760 [Mycobacterium xenopi 3993]|nr:hypothetical protein I552_5760 [Mycobacterium xenopi 3993]